MALPRLSFRAFAFSAKACLRAFMSDREIQARFEYV
jgi:hypothetical protein